MKHADHDKLPFPALACHVPPPSHLSSVPAHVPPLLVLLVSAHGRALSPVSCSSVSAGGVGAVSLGRTTATRTLAARWASSPPRFLAAWLPRLAPSLPPSPHRRVLVSHLTARPLLRLLSVILTVSGGLSVLMPKPPHLPLCPKALVLLSDFARLLVTSRPPVRIVPSLGFTTNTGPPAWAWRSSALHGLGQTQEAQNRVTSLPRGTQS